MSTPAPSGSTATREIKDKDFPSPPVSFGHGDRPSSTHSTPSNSRREILPRLGGAGYHRAVEGAMSHGFFAACSQLVRIHIGLFMSGEIDRLRRGKPVFC